MNPRNTFLILLFLLGQFALSGIISAQQTTLRLSSRFLARGEKALLEVVTYGREAEMPPVIPTIKDVSIQQEGFSPRVQGYPGRIVEYSFTYALSSYQVGRHTVPPIEVILAGGVRARTEPLDFIVFDPDELEWYDAEVNGMPFRYSAFFRTFKPTLFENETVYTEIKLYVPREISLGVVDWGIPDFERDGVASWRFEPGEARGVANLIGGTFSCQGYPTTMAATRTGTVGIGPAKVRLTHRSTVMDGILRRVDDEVFLQVPKLELESRPLPEPAPEGFRNAVGRFTVAATVADTEIREGDPVSVELVVSGQGNLDTLRPPEMIDPKGWKIYDATPNQRGDERRSLTGIVEFQQFMRPLELKSIIPPFRLVYFDPDAETYHTLTTEPITLKMLPSTAPPATFAAGPPQALSLPVERMTDILGNLQPAQILVNPTPLIPTWWPHALGGLAALILALKAIWMRLAPRLRKDPDQQARNRAWQEISRISKDDDPAFLRAAGAFVERWCSQAEDPALQEILTERDTLCFRRESTAKLLPSTRRTQILSLLRKASLTCLTFLLLTAATHPLHAGNASAAVAKEATTAFEAGDYEESIRIWLSAGDYQTLSADVLYNIGNASYRLGSPGHAALYYRRALAKDATHAEARQNLRFIERKHGAITVRRPTYQYALARISLASWQNAVWAGGWLALIGLLTFPATRPGAILRVVAVCVLVTAPVIASIGALGWRYFPDDSEFAPLSRQAVILGENVVLFSEASRTSPEVIDAPPGSLAEVIRLSGRWAYISFATKTRGWVPVESIEKIIPIEALTPPVIRKPKADARSA